MPFGRSSIKASQGFASRKSVSPANLCVNLVNPFRSPLIDALTDPENPASPASPATVKPRVYNYVISLFTYVVNPVSPMPSPDLCLISPSRNLSPLANHIVASNIELT